MPLKELNPLQKDCILPLPSLLEKQICFDKLITEVEADKGLREPAIQTSTFMTQQ
jgi:hypothetical protein